MSISVSSSAGRNSAPDRSSARESAGTRLVLRLVDLERTAVEFLAVQRLHRARRIGVGHLDEAEATRTTRLAIVDQRNLLHRAMRSEEGSNRVFGRGERKISNIKFCHEKSLE